MVKGVKLAHAAVKFPADKPVLIVADVPGQTPLALVVKFAVGNGYNPIL